MPHWTKLRCWQGCIPPWSSKGEFIVSSFSVSRRHLISGSAPPPISFLGSSNITSLQFSLHHHFQPVEILAFKDSSEYTGATWIVQNNLPISRQTLNNIAKSLGPCKVTYSTVPGIRPWRSLKDHYTACHNESIV